MSEDAVCADCLLPAATKAQWDNDHGNGNGCNCTECNSVCWGDYSYCRSVADERLRKHDTEKPAIERYRTALEDIAKSGCMQSKGEEEFFCKHDGSAHSCYCPAGIASAALKDD